MALFTDPDIVTLDDLLQFESTLTQVSSTHAIDITKKIKIAVDAIGDKVLLCLLRAGHTDPQWLRRANLGLSTVVVTPAIYKWICLDALSRIFAEAYNLQLNTRFQGKFNEYKAQADTASEIVLASGIGIVMEPLAKPALPSCSVGLGTMTAQSLFIQTAWIDASGQESALSPVNGLVLNGFSKISISSNSAASAFPESAIGWNVYGSESQQGMTRQNVAPVSLGQAWAMPETGIIQGSMSPGAQIPSYFVLPSRRWLRG